MIPLMRACVLILHVVSVFYCVWFLPCYIPGDISHAVQVWRHIRWISIIYDYDRALGASWHEGVFGGIRRGLGLLQLSYCDVWHKNRKDWRDVGQLTSPCVQGLTRRHETLQTHAHTHVLQSETLAASMGLSDPDSVASYDIKSLLT